MQPNVVLLAGGSGVRLWPLSTHNCPKQFITLPSINSSGFQLALRRSLLIADIKNITIITKLEYQELLYQQIESLNLDYHDFNIIFESHSNNTGIAAYYACLLLLQKNNHNLTYFCPTDHIISEESNFFEKILPTIDKRKINLFGQNILKTCSKFGYIFANRNISSDYYKVDKFLEKPGEDKTAIFNKNSHKIYKNLGIYLAAPSILYHEFQRLYKNLPSINFDKGHKHYIDGIHENLSIDKMIAERSSILNVKEVGFEWQDIGSMEILYQHCAGEPLNCQVNTRDIAKFNEQNKEFELSYNDGYVQIIKR